MTRFIWPLALMALLAVLAGCATVPEPAEPEEEEVEEEQVPEDEEPVAEEEEEDTAATVGAADCPPTCDFARGAIDDPGSILADRTIYFEFDSSDVQQEYMDIIERHAAYLAQYPEAGVRLEGHADERGSREYNIGLGERRANSVRDLLQAYGANADQMRTISYGEEMPAVEGHNEQAWSQNRRVELVYPASGLTD